MKILFVGHGRAGKDEAGSYLEKISRLKFAGTTSKYLTKYVAKELGISEEEAYRTRHDSVEIRKVWRQIGDETRKNDPALLVKEALKHGDISGGVRGLPEILAARDLVDLIIWVENLNVPQDPTVEFGSKECDLIIPNNWSLEEYRHRLKRLAISLKIHEPPIRRKSSLDCFHEWSGS